MTTTKNPPLKIPGANQINNSHRLKNLALYARLLQQVIGVCAVVYELITGEKAPPAKEVLKKHG